MKKLTIRMPYDVCGVGAVAGSERKAMLLGLSEGIGRACCEELIERDKELYGAVKDAGAERDAGAETIEQKIVKGDIVWWSDPSVPKKIMVLCYSGACGANGASGAGLMEGFTAAEIGEAVTAGLRGLIFNRENEIVKLSVVKKPREERDADGSWKISGRGGYIEIRIDEAE